MAESAYPIGSWEIVKTTNGHGVYEKGWGFVAIHDTSSHDHWNKGQAERRALIAAAPELLEALKELVRPYGVADVGMVSAPGPLQMEFIAAVRQAKDAIAKASGAQS